MEKTKTRSAKKISETAKKIVGIAPAQKSSVGRKSPARRAISPEDLSRRIQDKAYELFQERGFTHGDDQADWYHAERLVMAEISQN